MGPLTQRPKDSTEERQQHKIFRDLVEEDVKRIHLSLRDKDDKWLLELYRVHVDRFKIENDRIWQTGTIFVPLSFAAFGAYAQLESPNAFTVAALGIGSTALLWVWDLIANNHRHFQESHRTWMDAIEDVLSKRPSGITAPRTPKNQWGLPSIRLGLMAGFSFLWFCLLLTTIFFPQRSQSETKGVTSYSTTISPPGQTTPTAPTSPNPSAPATAPPATVQPVAPSVTPGRKP